MSKNKKIIVGGTYSWRMKVGVSEDKIEELREKFGVGTYHDQDIHSMNTMDVDDVDRGDGTLWEFVEELGGTMYSQNYDFGCDIDEFDIKEGE